MKNTLIIKGGSPLTGSIPVQGAKNEALQILAAILLYPGKTKVSNVPNILDIQELIKILKILGVGVEVLDRNTYLFDASNLDSSKIDSEDFIKTSSQLRGSIMIAGALLSRLGYSTMPTPGGDKIGIRPVSTHIKGFRDLGALVSQEDGLYRMSFQKTRSAMFTKRITLTEASVTGTANILLASVFHQGDENFSSLFEIYNAACEPYVEKLCELLISYGAKITGVGSNLLSVTPVPFSSINSNEIVCHEISPDMIELGSLISLAVVCAGENGINITNCPDADVVLGDVAVHIFRKLGVSYSKIENGIHVPRHKTIQISKPTTSGKHIRTIYDNTWPGLSPDHLSSLIAMAVHSKGAVTFKQRMFDRRLAFCDRLNDMGAQIIMSHHQEVTVMGNNRQGLVGIQMSSPDIRAGMALLIAALSAKEGESVINNTLQIHRGYENIVERLKALGADIREID